MRSITKRFGGLTALNSVSINVKKGEIRGLIGPNGSGKTTLLNVISGLYAPDEGTVYFKGEKLNFMRPHEIALKGIGRTFQIPKLFRKMTVLENLLVPAYSKGNISSEKEILERADELMKLVDICHLRNEYAANLSGGQQKLLEFVRALMLYPELILADEPFAGVHESIKERIMNLIKAMSQEGVAFIIVSHDMVSVFNMCQCVTVLAYGEKIAEGEPKALRNNPQVVEAYLGR